MQVEAGKEKKKGPRHLRDRDDEARATETDGVSLPLAFAVNHTIRWHYSVNPLLNAGPSDASSSRQKYKNTEEDVISEAPTFHRLFF